MGWLHVPDQGCPVIDQNGMRYTQDNIDTPVAQRRKVPSFAVQAPESRVPHAVPQSRTMRFSPPLTR